MFISAVTANSNAVNVNNSAVERNHVPLFSLSFNCSVSVLDTCFLRSSSICKGEPKVWCQNADGASGTIGNMKQVAAMLACLRAIR